MKRSNKLYLLLFLIAPAFFSCEKDIEDMESAGISRVETLPPLPEITIKGDEVMSVQIGEPFTDDGATATEGGTLSSTISYSSYITVGQADPELYTYGYKRKAIDTSKPGMYRIRYKATNAGGSTFAYRYLFVLTKPVDPAVDLTGTYSSGTSPQSKITRVAPGVYFSSNVWGGVSTVVISGFMVSPDGVDVNVPYQDEEDGSLVPIYGYGTRAGNVISMKMTRPTFATPLFDQPKIYTKI